MKLSLSFPTRISYALVILLLLATPLLLVWQHYGMTRTLELSPQRQKTLTLQVLTDQLVGLAAQRNVHHAGDLGVRVAAQKTGFIQPW